MKTTQPTLLSHLLLSATQAMREMFRPRQAALHGARASVLCFRPAHRYNAEGKLEHQFLVDALIEPAGEDRAWTPGELTMLPPEAAATLIERNEHADDLCAVLTAEIVENRRFVPAGDRTVRGTRRIRLRVAVRDGLAHLCFRHRDAVFGEVLLPAGLPCVL